METQNYSKGNRILWIALLIIAMTFIMCSCGSRRVDKSKTETKETTVTQSTKTDSSKVVTVSDANTKIVDLGTEEEFLVVPIDSSKEMVVNSVVYKNACLQHKKTSKNKVIENKAIVTETRQNDIEESVNTQSSKESKTETKNIDKKQFNILSLWWVILLLLGVYLYWRKFGFKSPF